MVIWTQKLLLNFRVVDYQESVAALETGRLGSCVQEEEQK